MAISFAQAYTVPGTIPPTTGNFGLGLTTKLVEDLVWGVELGGVVDEAAIAERYRLMRELLNERSRRRWAAAEARSAGQGGIAAVVRATRISESTVRRGLEELERAEELEAGRVRRRGAGRPSVLERDPDLEKDLDRLIDPVTRGDPESALRWTSKSGAKLAAVLQEMGHEVVDRTVLRILKAKAYSLQANEKTREGVNTRIAMRSFSTSTRRSLRRSLAGSRRFRSTQRSAS